MKLPPLSLYIHFPWCVKKCPYCDFNSHTINKIPQQEYIQLLIQDLQQQQHLAQGREIHSIFMGGGTPSLFSGENIQELLKQANQIIPFDNNIEITLETNPGTVEYDNFSSYFDAGVNRLSFGMQSFNDKQLEKLGRIHNSTENINAFELARKSGFKNINIDLMHGLPEQKTNDGLNDLQKAINLEPEHISWYQLTIEANTVFHNKPPTLPTENILCDIQDQGKSLLQENSYSQYEISAYSKNKKESTHNLNYWQFGDYLAIGAGAHGKITHGDNSISRFWQTRTPKDYLDPKKEFTANKKPLTSEELPLEFLMNALRLNRGFTQALFEDRTGLNFNCIEQQINDAVDNKLLVIESQKYKTTPTGQQFLNNLLELFLNE